MLTRGGSTKSPRGIGKRMKTVKCIASFVAPSPVMASKSCPSCTSLCTDCIWNTQCCKVYEDETSRLDKWARCPKRLCVSVKSWWFVLEWCVKHRLRSRNNKLPTTTCTAYKFSVFRIDLGINVAKYKRHTKDFVYIEISKICPSAEGSQLNCFELLLY